MLESKLTDELFTHVEPDTGEQTTWNATQLYDWCVDHDMPIARVAVDEEHAKHCYEKRGFEEARVPSLMQNPDWLMKPIVFVHLPDNTHLLVDGTHRYVIFYSMGMPHIRAYITEFENVRQFIVEDIPRMTEEQIMSPSLLPELRKIMGGQP